MLAGSMRTSASGGRPARQPNEQSRLRTFTGCRTCRNRHLKCDEAKPKCSTCRRANIPCEGYAPRLLWMTEQPANPDPAHREERSAYRYPLFSENARSSMSLELVESLGNQSAGSMLNDLENESPAADHHEYRSAGPFGVFRAFEDTSGHEQTTKPHPPQPEGNQSDRPGRTTRQLDPGNTTSTAVGGSQQEDSNSGHPQLQAGQSQDAPNDVPATFTADLAADIEDWMWLGSQFRGNSPVSFSFDNFIMNTAFQPLPSPQPFSWDDLRTRNPESLHHHRGSTPIVEEGRAANCLETVPRSVPAPANPDGGSALPVHAADLLRYLRAEVLEGPTSSTNLRLSPWKKLILPCALETFAELSLWNTTSHTRLGILCALLAKGAHHLHKSVIRDSRQSSRWREVAANHRKDAQKHLRVALREEVEGNNQAEYTELLMAMLGVCFVSMYFDAARVVKDILLDAEHVIRLRGFPSRKSLRLRILHHMYTHLRVIMESTNFTTLPRRGASSRINPIESSPVDVRLSSSFRVNESSLGDLDIVRNKPDEVGYYDIHLDVSGNWPLTLYPDIYGIPESIMTLHSQTISLANEKPKLDAAALADPAKSIALTQHIRTLEQQIWSWSMQESGVPEGPERPGPLVTADTPFYDKPDNKLLVLTMHEAIIIYFYRRVYNMNAMMLQDRVKAAMDYIQPYIEIGNYDQDFSISVGWALFIAACEAATPELQARAMECLEAIDGQGVFIETSQPSAIVKTVWEQRRQSGDYTLSWPDVMVQATLS